MADIQDTAPALVPVTTSSARLRHYARLEELRDFYLGGRTGTGLCTAHIRTDVYDQAALDAEAERWQLKKVAIADLPDCKRCARHLPENVQEGQ